MESPLTFSLMTSVQDVLLSTTRFLQEAGIEHADHESKILLGSAFGVSLSDISLASIMGMSLNDLQPVGRCRANRIADRQAYADTFAATVIRRSHHEPLQYIVGHAPFRYIDVALGPGVFIPRPETEPWSAWVWIIWLDWNRKMASFHFPSLICVLAAES